MRRNGPRKFINRRNHLFGNTCKSQNLFGSYGAASRTYSRVLQAFHTIMHIRPVSSTAAFLSEGLSVLVGRIPFTSPWTLRSASGEPLVTCPSSFTPVKAEMF